MKSLIKKNYWHRDIRLKEYLLAFARGCIVIFILCILFYRSVILTFCMLPCSLLYLLYWRKECVCKKKQRFQLQFKEAMQALLVALQAGYSIENAIRESVKDLQEIYERKSIILQEFFHMRRQIEMNISIEQVFREFSKRVDQEDVSNFTIVFNTAKRSGGDTITIMRNTILQITDKIDVKRDIDTVMAKKRMEFYIMTAVPIGMLGYMYLSFPEFMSVLYESIQGRVLMSVCLIIYLAAYAGGRKIIEIEV